MTRHYIILFRLYIYCNKTHAIYIDLSTLLLSYILYIILFVHMHDFSYHKNTPTPVHNYNKQKHTRLCLDQKIEKKKKK